MAASGLGLGDGAPVAATDCSEVGRAVTPGVVLVIAAWSVGLSPTVAVVVGEVPASATAVGAIAMVG